MAIDITLIFSRHKEGGICTANALLHIIKAVNPDVVFEELSHVLYKEAYVEKTLNNLESVAIRKYLETHKVEHIPVDIFDRPKNYERDQKYMNDRLEGSIGMELTHHKNLVNQVFDVCDKYGFHYLNGIENDMNIEKIEKLKQKVLKMLDDERLNEIEQIDSEVIEAREDVILDSVYNYSKENIYTKGLMFIGSGHRKSIMKKIAQRNKTENIKINWMYFQDLIIA